MAVPMGLLGKGKKLAKAAKEVATVAVKVARPVAAANGAGKEYETARAQVKVAAEAAKSLMKSLRGTSTSFRRPRGSASGASGSCGDVRAATR